MDVAVARKEPDQTTVATPPPATGEDTLSDDLADPLEAPKKKKPRTAKGTDKGKAEYQALLGEFLGDKLYAAVAPHLTQDSLAKYAQQGVDAGLKGLAGLLEGDSIDQSAVSKFAGALGKELGGASGKWLKSDSGQKVSDAMGGWVDANPEWVITIALLAAAAAVIADMKIPELKQKIGLGGGFDLEVAAKLGSLQNIALEEIRGTLKYQSDNLRAALTVKDDQEGVSVDTSARVGSDERYIEGTATVTEDGLKVWGIKGLQHTEAGDFSAGISAKPDKEPTYEASLTRRDGDVTVTDSVEYDSDAGVLSMKNKAMFEQGGGKVTATRTTSSDASQSAGLELEQKINENLAASMSATEESDAAGQQKEQLKAGLTYGDDKLKANVNAEYHWGETTSYSAGGSVSYKDGLNRAQLAYQYDSENHQHDVSAMGQVGLDDKTAVRGAVHYKSGDEGQSTEVSGYVARKLDLSDLTVFGGGTVEIDDAGKAKFVPEVGVQLQGVPIKVGYDPSNDSWRVGVTVPF